MGIEKNARLAYTEKAASLVANMTLQEKVDLMTGCYNPDALREAWRQTQNFSFYPYPTSGNDRLGVPPILFADGPRGAVCGSKQSTCFPATVCRGATFDTELEEAIGSAIGKELRAYGVNLFGGVCINLPYHPGWGRSQDVYGEDSFEIGAMGSAMVKGIQSEYVMACLKHYAFNSMENNRFTVNITCDERTEQEVFLSHFQDCINAGAACVMGAFNRYQGESCCQNEHLLREILKKEWDFDGFVISDWFSALDDTEKAVRAGLDVEMPTPRFYGDVLLDLVKKKQIPESYLDEACLRITRTVLAFEEGYQSSGKNYTPAVIGCEAHTKLALQAAREGITLLKNKNSILPFSPLASKHIAVLGQLAMQENLGDHSSSRVFPAYTVTPLDGISRLLPRAEIVYYGGENLAHAKRVAKEADTVILLVGNDYNDEGEYMTQATSPEYRRCIGGDRLDLHLKPRDVALIEAAGTVNPNTAVVMIGGSTILPTPWIDQVPAVLMAYYPGQEGGTALADILFGKVNPSGKLPFVIPRAPEDLPEVNWNGEHQFYEAYHGYARLEKKGIRPLYPFGFGLSYSTFTIRDAEAHLEQSQLFASCLVKNEGPMAGSTVVQLYVGFEHSQVERPHKLLRGFCRVTLKSGEEKRISISCPIEKLRYFDPYTKSFRLEHMIYQVYIGTSSDENDLLCTSVTL